MSAVVANKTFSFHVICFSCSFVFVCSNTSIRMKFLKITETFFSKSLKQPNRMNVIHLIYPDGQLSQMPTFSSLTEQLTKWTECRRGQSRHQPKGNKVRKESKKKGFLKKHDSECNNRARGVLKIALLFQLKNKRIISRSLLNAKKKPSGRSLPHDFLPVARRTFFWWLVLRPSPTLDRR